MNSSITEYEYDLDDDLDLLPEDYLTPILIPPTGTDHDKARIDTTISSTGATTLPNPPSPLPPSSPGGPPSSLLYSDYPSVGDFQPPTSPSAQAVDDFTARSAPPPHSFSDDLEASQLLQQEQKEKWDREGRVIRGSILSIPGREREINQIIGGDNLRRKPRRQQIKRGGNFWGNWDWPEGGRSSSLPPDSPTPIGIREEAVKEDNDEEEEEVEEEEETTPTATPRRKKVAGRLSKEESELALDTETTEVDFFEDWKMRMDIDMDVDGDVRMSSALGTGVPDSTMLEYPSSPPEEVHTPPKSRSAPQVKQLKAGPFAYADSDSDLDDADESTKSKPPPGPSLEEFFGSKKAIEVSNRNPSAKVGPFQEIDEDEEEEEKERAEREKEKRGFTGRQLTPPPIAPRIEDVDLFAEMNQNGGEVPRTNTTTTTTSTFNQRQNAPFRYADEDENEMAVDSTDALPDPQYSNTPGPDTVPVLLMSGKILHIKKRPDKLTPTTPSTPHAMKATYNGNGEREIKDSYYGVEIHKIIDTIQAEKRLEELIKDKSRPDKESSPPSPPQLADQKNSQKCNLLWTEKYRAKRFTDLLGDERTHRHVLRWLKSWDDIVFPGSSNKFKKGNQVRDEDGYVNKKILLITGPPGLGKTTLAHVAARQAGYEPMEINASDDRTAAVVKGRIRDALSNEGVRIPASTGVGRKKKGIGSGKPVCVIVDEIDGVTGGGGGGSGGEGGFMSALVDLILQDQKNSVAGAAASTTNFTRRRKRKQGDNFRFHRPLIAICNDLYAPSLRALRPLAEVVYMRKPPTNLIISRLKWVFDREGVPAEENAIRRLVELASSGSAAQSTYGGGGGGDMRGCLVGGEWLAKRLQSTLALDGKCAKLTRKIVEDEMEGGSGGSGGRDTSSLSRGGVRGCVERIFRKGTLSTVKKAPSGGGCAQLSTVDARRKEWEMLREEVECCGEFDKIITDAFACYLTRPYHDDVYLTKPCAAYEWLFFHDLFSHRVFNEQDYELMGYLGVPALAFNTLFACSEVEISQGAYLSSASGISGSEDPEKEPPPFTGPRADWEHREGIKSTKAIIQSLHNNLFSGVPPMTGYTTTSSSLTSTDQQTHATPEGIRFATAFKTIDSVVTELAPYLTRILSPKINPVLVGGPSAPATTSGATSMIASVRKDSERRLVKRAVEVMYTVGIGFEKVRIESSTFGPGIGTGGFGGWVYRMEPGLDQLTGFVTWNTPAVAMTASGAAIVGGGATGAGANGPQNEPVRYAVRQVLVQELSKYMVLKKQEVREKRAAKMGGSSIAPLSTIAKKQDIPKPTPTQQTSTGAVKRDFFGRIVQPKPPPSNCQSTRVDGDEMEGLEGPGGKRRRRDHDNDDDDDGKIRAQGKVWVSFNEGFSNAVKKGVTLEDLLGVLY